MLQIHETEKSIGLCCWNSDTDAINSLFPKISGNSRREFLGSAIPAMALIETSK